MKSEIIHGDNIEELRKLPDNSIDAVVTDAPYGLGKEPDPVAMLQAWITTGYMEVTGGGFMGKAWDAFVPQPAFWKEVFRVLKPGGHVLCFFGTRTYDWGVMAMRIAGFEIRDQVQWLYGSGFPKSLDVSKAIDKQRDDSADGAAVGAWLKAQREARGLKQKDVAALWPSATGGLTGCVANWETLGKVPKWDQWIKLKEFIGFGDEMDAEVWRLNGRKGKPGEAWDEREVIGKADWTNSAHHFVPGEDHTQRVHLDITTPATAAAKRWNGWGTALKPANEPIVLARKPLCGTVAANVMQHGTGALNVDACRVGENRWTKKDGENSGSKNGHLGQLKNRKDGALRESALGRWPANVIHDGSDEVLQFFPESDGQSGAVTGNEPSSKTNNTFGEFSGRSQTIPRGDSGSAARFFYSAKASKKERDAGLCFFPAMSSGDRSGGRKEGSAGLVMAGGKANPYAGTSTPARNGHPTVKPIGLMLYLCKLITPPGGVVLDPFVGSGTTGIAAKIGGFQFIGMEREAEYIPVAQARIAWWNERRWNEYQEGLKPKPEEKKESAQQTLF